MKTLMEIAEKVAKGMTLSEAEIAQLTEAATTATEKAKQVENEKKLVSFKTDIPKLIKEITDPISLHEKLIELANTVPGYVLPLRNKKLTKKPPVRIFNPSNHKEDSFDGIVWEALNEPKTTEQLIEHTITVKPNAKKENIIWQVKDSLKRMKELLTVDENGLYYKKNVPVDEPAK